MAGYHLGRYKKQVPADKFIDVYNRYINHEVSLNKGSKELGVSLPTFKTWIEQVITKSILSGKPYVDTSDLDFIEGYQGGKSRPNRQS